MNPLQAAAVLVGSGILSWVVVTLSIRLAHRLEVFDHPDGGRKTQVRPIPKLGGVAVALAFTAVILAGVLITDRLGFVLGLGVLVPALAAAVIGFLDDRSHLNPYVRLVLQAGVGLLAWLMGTRIALSGNEVLDALLLILWIMVIINGTNLLDNSDGLAASTVLIMSVGAAIVAAVYGQALVSLMGVALVGVSIGYLWHNWFPAKVYMGDSGAYFLGTLVAIMAVRLKPEGVPPSIGVLIVVLLVLLPLVDTTYVVIKRLRRGVHPFTAGRDHLSHVLQGRGMSVPLSVVTLALVLAYLVTLRRGAVAGSRFMTTSETLLSKGDLMGLLAISNRHRDIVAVIMTRTLEFLARNPTATDDQLREIAQTEGGREASLLNQRVAWLADIATIAPMLGLLGTVFGMIRSFSVMANDVAASRPMLLAEGVAEALVATAAGLVIGIPAMAAYAWFRGRVQEMISEMEGATALLLVKLVIARGTRDKTQQS